MSEDDRRTRQCMHRVVNDDGNKGICAAFIERSRPGAEQHGVRFERASGERRRVFHSLTGWRELNCGVLGGPWIAALSAATVVLSALSSNRRQ